MMKEKAIGIIVSIILISTASQISISASSTGIIPPLLMNAGNHPNKQNTRKQGTTQLSDWFNKSPQLDKIEGASIDRVYSDFTMFNIFFPVVVAVIDSGIDIHHEDLKGKIWTNPYEIPNNRIDDDFNGYVDDIHGWNFIGGKDGRNVEFDTLEVTREFYRYTQKIKTGEPLTAKEMTYFEKVKKDYNEGRNHAQDILNFSLYYKKESERYKKVLREKIGIKDFSRTALDSLNSKDSRVNEARFFLLETLDTFRTYGRIELFIKFYSTQINYHYNTAYNSRMDIVKDNPKNLNEIGYGNNDISASFSDHGTHVAGIIAANRKNKLGIKGVASNVKIMVLRAVPNGDERDKDIANAVRYAVNNGARIINMSFGKGYSPHKEVVDQAFEYAARRGVLIVHAAGNDSTNNDRISNFPNRYLKQKPSEVVKNWVDVGASSYFKENTMVTYFSNFGKNTVDIFAPGYRIMSTTRKSNYASFSGTSMASPVFSGAAALVLSQAPFLDGGDLKELLLSTARVYPDLEVNPPDNPQKLVPFSDISRSGGIVDLYRAFQELFEE